MKSLQVLELVSALLSILKILKAHGVETTKLSQKFDEVRAEDRDMTEEEVQGFIDVAQSAIDNARND